MRKLLIALLAALAIALVAAGCGDDDDNGGDTSPTENGTASARPSRTEEAEATPTEDGEKTPSNETPDETTPAPTEAGPQPTPAAEGTPATLIEDPSAYFSSNYPGQSLDESDCGFSPVTYIVTCGSDRYAPNPPLTGQDVSCARLSVQGDPVAIRCTSQEPLQTAYYEIQGS